MPQGSDEKQMKAGVTDGSIPLGQRGRQAGEASVSPDQLQLGQIHGKCSLVQGHTKSRT